MTSATATKPLTKKAQREAEQAEAAAKLREIFPIGSTVSTVMTHVSSSGMLRAFRVIVGQADGSVRDVTHLVITAGGFKRHKGTGDVAMGGCGMDMGFALVYSLSRTLYRDAFYCTGVDHGRDRCPANDHSNEWGDRRPANAYSTSRLHSDAGYALNQRHV